MYNFNRKNESILSAAWPSETACGFHIRQRELHYGCRSNADDTSLRVAGDSKIASSFPSHLYFYIEFKFVKLKRHLSLNRKSFHLARISDTSQKND